MKILAGALKSSSGDVEYRFSTPGNPQARIGYLPENAPLDDSMRVQDYLFWRASMYGLHGEAAVKAVSRVMESTGVTQRATDVIGRLSKGYRQRVGVAQAILHDPELVILDEPTNGLDPQQILQMRKLLKSLSQKAVVIISTHILQEVQASCDRVLVMRRGQLASDTLLESDNKVCVTATFRAEADKCISLFSESDSLDSWEVIETGEGTCRFRLYAQDKELEALTGSLVSMTTSAGIALLEMSRDCSQMENIMLQLDEGAINV